MSSQIVYNVEASNSRSEKNNIQLVSALDYSRININQGQHQMQTQATCVHVQNPVQLNYFVVTKEEIEAPWRAECEYFIKEIERIKSEKGLKIDNSLELERYRLLVEENQGLRSNQKILQDELKLMRSQCELLKLQNQELMNNEGSVSETQISYYLSEVTIWKDRFIKSNHDYSDCQEKLTFCEAELDALKKETKNRKNDTSQASRTIKTTTVTSSSNQMSSGLRSSVDRQSLENN